MARLRRTHFCSPFPWAYHKFMSAFGKTDQALTIFALRGMHGREEASAYVSLPRVARDGPHSFAAIVKIACPRATMPLRERQRCRHSPGVDDGNKTRTRMAATGGRKPVSRGAPAIGNHRATVRARKPNHPRKPAREGSLWRRSGRVPPSPRRPCQAQPWQLLPRTPSRQHQR
jgi:hypothetical protein